MTIRRHSVVAPVALTVALALALVGLRAPSPASLPLGAEAPGAGDAGR